MFICKRGTSILKAATTGRDVSNYRGMCCPLLDRAEYMPFIDIILFRIGNKAGVRPISGESFGTSWAQLPA
jgi:hypothetical protein